MTILVSSKWYTFGTYPCCTIDKKKVLTYHSNATWVSPHKLTWESERQHREVNSLSDHPYGSADCDEQLTWRKSLTHSWLTGDERCRSRSHMTGIICRHPSHAAGPCLSRGSMSECGQVTKNCGNLLQKCWFFSNFVRLYDRYNASFLLFE